MKLLSPLQVSKLLRGTVLLGEAREEELAKLAERARHEQFKAGEVVFSKNARATPLYCVARGRIKITSQSHGGNEFLLGWMEGGQMVGELALVDDRPRSVNAVAERKSYILRFARRDVMAILEQNPAVSLALARILCGHIREAVSNLENLGLHDAKTRLWLRLKHLGRRYGRLDPATGRLHIEHSMSQQSLADSIGLTRVMVNRQLGIWRDEELIDYDRGSVTFLDPVALEAHVRGGSSPLVPQAESL